MRRLASALVCMTACAAAAQGVTRHPAMPHLLMRVSQPQVVCFAPGNAGEASLREPPGRPGNVARQGELRCDGLVIEAYSPDYRWKPVAGDEYWQRLEGALAPAALAGMIVDFRVTIACTAMLASGGEAQVHGLAKRLAAVANRRPCIIVSFDCPLDNPAAAKLWQALRTASPRLLLGQRLIASGDLRADADFAVVRPHDAPPGYRDQAAVGYWHHKLSGRPAIFEADPPDPNASLFWFAAGVAGLQHASLPPEPDLENNRRFLTLRSLSVLLLNLPDGRCPPRPELAGGGIAFAMGTPNDFMGYLLEPASAPGVAVTSSPARQDVVAFWFSSARNQSIIEPRQPGPVSRHRTLSQPSNDGWFWGYYALPRPDDGGSTVTEGRDIPPGPFM